jgi:addiction module HigA family antidote
LVAAATHLRCASVSVGCRGNLSPLRSGLQNALGRALGVSPRSINEIVLGRRAITPEMSLKLGKFFKQRPQFWFNIQTNCDFRRLMRQAHRITAKVKSDFTNLAA